MSYICFDCGHIFEEGEQAKSYEHIGEHFGYDAFKKISGCPLCGGDYEECTSCLNCGGKFLDDDLNGGLCNDCIDEHRYDVDVCVKIGEQDTENVELNCFLAFVFDKEEIEEILLEQLMERKKYKSIDCKKFIDSDRSWFAERLLEELEKVKNGQDI